MIQREENIMKYEADITLKFKDGSTGAKVLGPFDSIQCARDFADRFVSESIRNGQDNDDYCVVRHKVILSEAV